MIFVRNKIDEKCSGNNDSISQICGTMDNSEIPNRV